IRMTGVGIMPKIAAPTRQDGKSTDAAALRSGTCVFRVSGELRPFETTYYERDNLSADASITGPAIIVQTDTTIVVPPDWVATIETGENIILRKES
ncbi:MAG: hydantoinase/oxoprolinase family protein, partial [Alphaproteobacteria bacterium]|nr:hydantoinase/oxoprolinase family protein [Alphaproteobacteria bacterium]